MFEDWSKYQFILVTGPQRSGTTIAARMIAGDTGKEFIPEAAMVANNKIEEARALPKLLEYLYDYTISAVVQCPLQCRYIHSLPGHMYTDTLVIMVYRDVVDIIASEKRIGWSDGLQRQLYSDVMPYVVESDTPISKIKYVFWQMVQRPHIYRTGNFEELHYEELCHHPLWIPKEQRVGFGPRQIGPDEDYATMKLEVLV